MLENIYLTIAIVAVLMLIDYFLTLKGFALYKQTHAQYVDVESYELNPMFKRSVDQQKYSFQHLLSVVLVALFLYGIDYLAQHQQFGFEAWASPFIQGILLSMFVYINSRHIQNLVVYRELKKDHSLLSGKIQQKHLYSLHVSSAHAFGAFIILFILYLFVQNPFTLGFAVGPLTIVLKNRRWIRQYMKKTHHIHHASHTHHSKHHK